MKKKMIFVLSMLLIAVLCCVYTYRHNDETVEVLYTANVDLNIDKEEVVRISNDDGSEDLYEIRWADGKRIVRTNEDAFAEYCVKAYNLDLDQELEIVTWFAHNASTSPETAYAELVVFDLQPNGEYIELPLPRLGYDPEKVGLDFQIIYQGKHHKLAFFEVKEPTIPYRTVVSVHIPEEEAIAEQLMEKFQFTKYAEDYITPESPITSKIYVPRLDGELALQLCQYIGEYKNELFMAHYWIRWDENGAYEIVDVGFEGVEEYDRVWIDLENGE